MSEMCSGRSSRYSKWVPVHVRNMIQKKYTHPSVYHQFEQGHFTLQKARHTLSLMAMEQKHEQFNEVINGYGGVMGLTDNPVALLTS